jgi:hypothetical protein
MGLQLSFGCRLLVWGGFMISLILVCFLVFRGRGHCSVFFLAPVFTVGKLHLVVVAVQGAPHVRGSHG